MLMNAKLLETVKVTSYAVTVEGPADVAWVDCTGYRSFAAVVTRTVGTGGLDDLRILGNPNADGSGTDIVLVSATIDSTTLSTVDAVGDYVFIEAGPNIFAANPTMKGICVSLGHVTATDDTCVTYILGNPRSAPSNADVVA